MTAYTLTRSKRKTIALYIRDGAVEVRAPLRAAKRDIDAFVASKEGWIRRTLAAVRESAAARDGFSLAYGSAVTYRGTPYPIAARQGDAAGFDGERFFMPPGLTPPQIRAACAAIYRALAKRLLPERAAIFARRMSLAPTAVKISGAKARWGSCSSRGSLNFSWRLVMADDEAIDYVVVHELAHLAQMNHSPEFWAVVAAVLPDCRARRARLRDLQKKLDAEGWDEV